MQAMEERGKLKRVGNAGLYIGLAYANRKSLPRDSRGFEPIDLYFNNPPVESDSDSSDTDTEELIRQEKEKRRAAIEARKKPQHNGVATKDVNGVADDVSGEEGGQDEDDDATVTGRTDLDEGGGVTVDNTTQQSSMDKYSPLQSMAVSPDVPVSKVVPTKLSFSASSNEGGLENSPHDTPKSARRHRTARRTILLSPKRSNTLRSSTVSKPRKEAPSLISTEPGNADLEDTTKSGETEATTSVQTVEKSLPSAGKSLFLSTKTSTQIPKGKSKLATSTASKRKHTAPKISSIRPIYDESEDEDSTDEFLKTLIGAQDDRLQALSQLTRANRTTAGRGKKDGPSVTTDVKKKSRKSLNFDTTSVRAGKQGPHRSGTTGTSRKKTAAKASDQQDLASDDDVAHKTTSRKKPAKKPSSASKQPSLSSDEEARKTTSRKKPAKKPPSASKQPSLSSDEEAHKTTSRKKPAKKPSSASKQPSLSSDEEARKTTSRKKTKASSASKQPSLSSDEEAHKTTSRKKTKASTAQKQRSLSPDEEVDKTTSRKKTKASTAQKQRSLSPDEEVDKDRTRNASTIQRGRKSTRETITKGRATDNFTTSVADPSTSTARTRATDTNIPIISTTGPSKENTIRKRKSILKEVSLVVEKVPSPKWFAPSDIGKSLSQASKSRSRSQSQERKSSIKGDGTKSRSSKGKQDGRSTAQKKKADVPRPVVSDENQSSLSDYDSQDSSHNVHRPPSSAGSMAGESAVLQDHGEAGPSPLSISRKPAPRKRRNRGVVPSGLRRKQKKTEAQSNEQQKEDSELSTDEEEEEMEEGGLDFTFGVAGGKFRRLAVQAKQSHTPGVRRSKRTRVAPVKHWVGEEVEYDRKRLSGAKIQGVLVPVEEEAPRVKRPRVAGSEEEEDFSPLRITDRKGNLLEEISIIETVASALKMNEVGEEAEDVDEMVISRLHASTQTSNGLLTFSALGEKAKSKSAKYEMFFYVVKGKLIFKIGMQEYRLSSRMSVHVPEGMVYSIRNPLRTTAEAYFYTHLINT